MFLPGALGLWFARSGVEVVVNRPPEIPQEKRMRMNRPSGVGFWGSRGGSGVIFGPGIT